MAVNESASEIQGLITAAKKQGLLSRDQEVKLFRQLRSSDPVFQKRIRDKIILSNVLLVLKIAKQKRFRGRGVELADRVMEGIVGLNKAIDKFDPDRGYKFSTYCHPWIWQAISRVILQQGRLITLPIYIEETLGKVKNAYGRLSHDKSGKPTLEKLEKETGIKAKKISDRLARNYTVCSLDRVIPDSSDTILDFIPSEGETPWEYLERSILQDEIDEFLKELPPIDRIVLCHRFGLKGFEEMTQMGMQDKIPAQFVPRKIRNDKKWAASSFRKTKKKAIVRLKSIADSA